MKQFEVTVTIVINADDDNEAYAGAEAAAQNLVCGDIVRVEMGGVTDLSMAE